MAVSRTLILYKIGIAYWRTRRGKRLFQPSFDAAAPCRDHGIPRQYANPKSLVPWHESNVRLPLFGRLLIIPAKMGVMPRPSMSLLKAIASRSYSTRKCGLLPLHYGKPETDRWTDETEWRSDSNDAKLSINVASATLFTTLNISLVV